MALAEHSGVLTSPRGHLYVFALLQGFHSIID
jgi:hypothetical protein